MLYVWATDIRAITRGLTTLPSRQHRSL